MSKTTPSFKMKGQAKAHRDALIRTYDIGGTHVFGGDAVTPLFIVLTDDDIKKGKPEDPNGCAYALSCKRMFGSTAVLFFKTIAYVDLPTADGKWEIRRFRNPGVIEKNIRSFDALKKATAGGVTLKVPEGNYALDTKREKSVQDRKKAKLKGRKKAKLKGTMKSRARKGIKQPRSKAVVSNRPGTGAVHMTPAS